MSHRAVDFVLAQHIPSAPQKLLMVALAYHADDESGRWTLKQKTLGKRASMCERQVRTHTKKLEEEYRIVRHERRNPDGSQAAYEYEIVGYAEWRAHQEIAAVESFEGAKQKLQAAEINPTPKDGLTGGGNQPHPGVEINPTPGVETRRHKTKGPSLRSTKGQDIRETAKEPFSDNRKVDDKPVSPLSDYQEAAEQEAANQPQQRKDSRTKERQEEKEENPKVPLNPEESPQAARQAAQVCVNEPSAEGRQEESEGALQGEIKAEAAEPSLAAEPLSSVASEAPTPIAPAPSLAADALLLWNAFAIQHDLPKKLKPGKLEAPLLDCVALAGGLPGFGEAIGLAWASRFVRPMLTFDWLCQPNSFAKLLRGDYADAPAASRRKRSSLPAYSESFGRFWSAFPERQAMSKADAFRSWLDQKCDDVQDEVIAGAMAYASFFAKQRRSRPDYPVKHAQGWLSGRRWESFETKAPMPGDQCGGWRRFEDPSELRNFLLKVSLVENPGDTEAARAYRAMFGTTSLPEDDLEMVKDYLGAVQAGEPRLDLQNYKFGAKSRSGRGFGGAEAHAS